jgi:hypothetical protein
LFGVWGDVRFVYARFDWVSNRIMRRRKAWLAKIDGLTEEGGFEGLFTNRWWFVIGEALMKVILPIECYQIRRNGAYEWDDLGWLAYQRDLDGYSDLESVEDRRRQSWFDFFCAEGVQALGYTPAKAAQYAGNRLGNLATNGGEFDPQLILGLQAAIERTKKNINP